MDLSPSSFSPIDYKNDLLTHFHPEPVRNALKLLTANNQYVTADPRHAGAHGVAQHSVVWLLP